MSDDDKRIWDKGTPFQSPSDKPKEPEPRDDDIIWDKGTPFESRQPRNQQ
jgi:hypothetical protein